MLPKTRGGLRIIFWRVCECTENEEVGPLKKKERVTPNKLMKSGKVGGGKGYKTEVCELLKKKAWFVPFFVVPAVVHKTATCSLSRTSLL